MSARELAFIILQQVFYKNAYANILLSQKLQQHHLSRTDKSLCTEIVYGVLRKRIYLEWIVNKFSKKAFSNLDKPVQIALLMALYQIVFLDRIPHSAAVNESVKLVKKHANIGAASFTNAILRNYLRQRDDIIIPSRKLDLVQFLSLLYNQPPWLIKFFLSQWPCERVEKLFSYYDTLSHTWFRVNLLKSTVEDVQEIFKNKSIPIFPGPCQETFYLMNKDAAFLQPLLASGKIYIQDLSSVYVSYALNPRPGEKILDLCAAPGGKSSHIAALTSNNAKIISCDIHEHKVELLRQNRNRLGASAITPILYDATKLNDKWIQKFDKVLVDTPCSGLGVLGKKPDMRWNRTLTSVLSFPALQKRILMNAARYVAPGGLLVYSTCTLNQKENSDIVSAFLCNDDTFCKASFTLPGIGEVSDGEITIWPPEQNSDGFYISVLKKG